MDKTVFISYSSLDKDIVNDIVNMLSDAKISYWIAPEMIPIGSNYAKEIPGVIRSCGIFLLIISQNSQESIWVEKELDYAINMKRKIIPINISETNLSDMFRFYLNNVQMVLCEKNHKIDYEALKKRILEELYDEDTKNSENEKKEEVEQNKKTNSVSGIKTVYDRKKKINYSSDAFTMNKQPTECQYCGGELNHLVNGIYECKSCNKENYDYFQTVKRFLQNEGPSTIREISEKTGIPKRNIEYFLKEEKLQIPARKENYENVCLICGKNIGAGKFCIQCRNKARRY